jgi:uncharacterized damage-inducible protein DinB
LQTDQIRLLYDYDSWANERLLRSIEALTEEELNAPMSNGIGSIRVTLVHMLNGEHLWRNRWEGRSLSAGLSPDAFPTLTMLKDRWKFEHECMRTFLSTLRDEGLTQAIAYTNTQGKPFAFPLWQLMVHLLSHEVQHRSEIALRLTELGHSPGELGMQTFFLTKE